MLHSWSDRPDAAALVREAALAGHRDEALELLGEKGGLLYAADVLASLHADIERVKDAA